MTTLVAVGCSHMAGSELDGEHTDGVYNRQNCFAAKVAKNLNFNYINLALSGGSNQFIHRKTIEFITTYMNQNEDYFFLIGWTSPLRMELRYSQDNNYTHHTLADYADLKYVPFTSGMDKDVLLDTKMRKLTKFVDVLFEDNLKYNEYATLVYSIQEILKKHNLKYYMINAVSQLVSTPFNYSIVNKIDTDFFYKPTDFNSTYFNICKDVFNHKKYSKYWHHLEPAHTDYSIFLTKLIKEAHKL